MWVCTCIPLALRELALEIGPFALQLFVLGIDLERRFMSVLDSEDLLYIC